MIECERFEDMLSRYIKGELGKDEEAAFMRLLSDNAELRNKAIATARLVKAMNDVGSDNDRGIVDSLKGSSPDDVKNIVAMACGENKNIMSKKFPFTLRKLTIRCVLAASIAVCVIAGYKYYKYDQVTKLGVEYLAYFPASEFIRGEAGDINGTLQRLYGDIATKNNIGKVIGELHAMWEKSREDTYNEYTEYMPQIGWMLANAYLRNNEKTKAVGILEMLSEEYPATSAMGAKTRELRSKIERL